MYKLDAIINDICIRTRTSITEKRAQQTLSVGTITSRIQHVQHEPQGGS